MISIGMTLLTTTHIPVTCEGAISYTYDYADCAGLPYSWVYTYTIDHVTAPVVPADGAQDIECLANATAPTTPTVVDVCELMYLQYWFRLSISRIHLNVKEQEHTIILTPIARALFPTGNMSIQLSM